MYFYVTDWDKITYMYMYMCDTLYNENDRKICVILILASITSDPAEIDLQNKSRVERLAM